MGKYIFAIIFVSIGFIFGWLGHQPQQTKPSPSYQSQFSVGQKVYYQEYAGTILAKAPNNQYVVKYCGSLGWFGHYACVTDTLSNWELATT